MPRPHLNPYPEPFTPAHVLTFILIWSGLALYTADAVRTFRNPAASRDVSRP
jgi:EamA domain-containing membrane protein RarD